MIYDELEDYERMLECYGRVLKINPNEYAAWFNMGIYYENNRFYRNAIKCYDNSLKIFQDDEDAWLNEANCYLELKNSYMVKFCYKKCWK